MYFDRHVLQLETIPFQCSCTTPVDFILNREYLLSLFLSYGVFTTVFSLADNIIFFGFAICQMTEK